MDVQDANIAVISETAQMTVSVHSVLNLPIHLPWRSLLLNPREKISTASLWLCTHILDSHMTH